MGEGSSGSVPTLPPGGGDSETKRALPGPEPPAQPWPANPVQPSYQPVTEVGSPPPTVPVPHQPAAIVRPPQPGAAGVPHEPVTDRPPGGATAEPPSSSPPPSEVVRYGPGVPASQAAAESVWRTGHRPGPAARQRGARRLRRLLGLALTVVLLIAAGVVLWLRFFDHPSFAVTKVSIAQQARSGCTVDVTGRITTNGSAGTVSYQWVFRPQTQAPQPLNQTVVAGQHDVYVTVAVQGQGHGTASQTVTLDVLGPDTGTASTKVTISC
jgi:hypothetical protein